MASTPPSASDIRRIVREELQPVETRITAKIETEIGELKEMLVGVVDEDFPPVDQRPRSGGSSGGSNSAGYTAALCAGSVEDRGVRADASVPAAHGTTVPLIRPMASRSIRT